MVKMGRVSIAVGAFVLAAAIGVFASGWTELIKPHPHALAATFIVGLVMVLWPVLYRFGLFASTPTSKHDVTFNTISAPIQDMQIRLIEHGEFSSELLLECVNRGGLCTLTANLRVTGASPGVAYKRVGYSGRWVKPVSLAHNRMGVEYDWKPSASVATGDSANLRIATIDAPQKPEGPAYMELYGTNERATWDLEYTPTSDLPYFIVDIEIRAKGKNGVVKRTYKVGPPHRNESLRMTEVLV
jgi:hypothetical protein